MKLTLKVLSTVILIAWLPACTVTGPADDGFENSQESLDIGKLQDGEAIDRLAKKAAKAVLKD